MWIWKRYKNGVLTDQEDFHGEARGDRALPRTMVYSSIDGRPVVEEEAVTYGGDTIKYIWLWVDDNGRG
jgi:hypothetical protein